MIAENIQDDFIADLKEIFRDFKLKNSSGQLQNINVFAQHLPVRTAKPSEYIENDFEAYQKDEAESLMPFIIVYIQDGTIQSEIMANEVNLSLAIGVYDDDDNKQGHRHIINMIGKISERYEKNDILAKKYIAQYPMEWTLQEADDDSWPCFYGGMSMTFDTATFRRENKYS